MVTVYGFSPRMLFSRMPSSILKSQSPLCTLPSSGVEKREKELLFPCVPTSLLLCLIDPKSLQPFLAGTGWREVPQLPCPEC